MFQVSVCVYQMMKGIVGLTKQELRTGREQIMPIKCPCSISPEAFNKLDGELASSYYCYDVSTMVLYFKWSRVIYF